MIKVSFIKESLLFTIGNALPITASVILLPFYANYLDTVNYITLSFYIGISLLFQILFSFSFEQYYGVIYTEIKQDTNKVKVLNGSVFIYLILHGLLIMLLSIFFAKPLLSIIFQEDIPVVFYPYGLLSIVTGFFNALFKVSISHFIYAQKPNVFFFSNGINFLATITFSLTGLLLIPNSLSGPIYGRFLSGLVIVFFNYIIIQQNVRWAIEWAYIKELLSKTWSLFVYAIVMWLTSNADRYFLKNYVNVHELASYDLIMKCFIGIEFIQNGLSMAIISKIFNIWKNENKITFSSQANKYFNGFIISNITAILIFVFLLPFFIQLIIEDHTYYASFKYTALIGSVYILRVLSYPYYFSFLYSKKTLRMFALNAMIVVLQILLSYIYISQYGLIAAIFIHILTKILIVVFYQYYHLNNFQNHQIIQWFGIPVFITILSILLFYYFKENYLFTNLSLFTISFILIFLVYKNELKLLYQTLLSKIFK